MTLKVALSGPKLLKSILEPIPPINEGVILEFAEDGLQLHTGMEGLIWAIEAKLKKSEFETYEVSDDNRVFNVSLKELTDFIKTASPSETLTIGYDEQEGTLKFILSRDQLQKEIDLRILGISEDYRFRNLINFQSKLNLSLLLSVNLLNEAMKISTLGGTHVEMVMDKNSLNFVSKGTTKKANMLIEFDNEEVSNVTYKSEKEKSVAIFALDYLKNLSKFSKIQDNVLLCFDDSKPLLGIFQFPEEAGYVAIAIAPRSN